MLESECVASSCARGSLVDEVSFGALGNDLQIKSSVVMIWNF